MSRKKMYQSWLLTVPQHVVLAGFTREGLWTQFLDLLARHCLSPHANKKKRDPPGILRGAVACEPGKAENAASDDELLSSSAEEPAILAALASEEPEPENTDDSVRGARTREYR